MIGIPFPVRFDFDNRDDPVKRLLVAVHGDLYSFVLAYRFGDVGEMRDYVFLLDPGSREEDFSGTVWLIF